MRDRSDRKRRSYRRASGDFVRAKFKVLKSVELNQTVAFFVLKRVPVHAARCARGGPGFVVVVFWVVDIWRKVCCHFHLIVAPVAHADRKESRNARRRQREGERERESERKRHTDPHIHIPTRAPASSSSSHREHACSSVAADDAVLGCLRCSSCSRGSRSRSSRSSRSRSRSGGERGRDWVKRGSWSRRRARKRRFAHRTAQQSDRQQQQQRD